MSSHYVVVGGSKGIGLGVVQQLVSEGHQISVLSRSSEQLGSLTGVTHVTWDATVDDFPDGQLPSVVQGARLLSGEFDPWRIQPT